MVHVTIDGNTIEVPEKTTVLQAARMANVHIPTLCDHPALKPYGSCRLCVVEIDGFRTLQSSCTLPVGEGMVIRTNTPKLQAARKFILSLLFSERNHFCMYCQKTDGDCELQNCAYTEQMDHWPMQPNWNPYPVDASHPYSILDNNRCILCRRCVRACADLVGNYTLGIENRGSNNVVIADNGLPWGESTCVRCGTCVELCPTGALIDRQSAYLGKANQSEHIKSTCIGCSVGCGIEMIIHEGRLLRINGDGASPVNRGVLCEEGRYKALQLDLERIHSPMVRKDGKLVAVSWNEALDAAANHLAPLRNIEKGVAALASTRLSIEALYQFKQLFEQGFHSTMVASIEEDATTAIQNAILDSSIRNGSLETLGKSDCVLVFGADLVRNHQVAGFLIKRNLLSGTSLVVVDPFRNEMMPAADYPLHPKAGSDVDLLKGIMVTILRLGLDKAEPDIDLAGYTVEKASNMTGIPVETLVAASRQLALAKNPVFVYGKGVTAQQNGASVLKALASLAGMIGAEILCTKGKANSSAAHAFQLDKSFNPDQYQAAFIALGDDYPYERLINSLNGIPCLIIQATYRSPLLDKADIVLPVRMWAEQEGHYLNLDDRLQLAVQAIPAPESILSNVDVLTRVASCLGMGTDSGWKEMLYQNTLAPAL
ncbi:MAG: molybdopterin-dependent oxidoreductase [Omnitrophica WOR_2 bacterium]